MSNVRYVLLYELHRIQIQYRASQTIHCPGGETKLTVPSVVGKDSQYYFLTPNSPTLATEGRLRMFLFSKMSQDMSAVSLLHFQIALGDSNDLQRFSKLLGCTVVVPL